MKRSKQKEIKEQIKAVLERMKKAAESAGRDPSSVQLVAITKTWPLTYHQAAYDAGCRLLGESKLQEAEEKIEALPNDVEWHFIGHLQRNKARKIVERFSVIHAIDSLKLASSVDRVAGELEKCPRAYIQVNLGDEKTKFGFKENELKEQIEELGALKNMKIEGLMCLPPYVNDLEKTRHYFRSLRLLRNFLEDKTGKPLPGLSMGMSADFEIAIEEGATMVRVGSTLFGSRAVKER